MCEWSINYSECVNGVLTTVSVCLCLQGVESVFDIMDMEDEDRNTLLRFSDAQMQVHVHMHIFTTELSYTDHC